MTVRCASCGQEWPRDPCLEVACPMCHAGVGVKCRRPSGHGIFGKAFPFHPERERRAMALGILARCPAAPSDSRPTSSQANLFPNL